MEWRIGCSGYHYPEWKRVFYPDDLPQRRWFEFYSNHFNTLELNVTYYRFPRLDVLKRWKERSPDGFSFAVKAPRHITHFKKFREAQRMLGDFYQLASEGLGEKLGCILFQFPAVFQFSPDRLVRITEMLDASFRNVLEFRHESWWRPEVFGQLRKSNVSFCGMSHPGLPDEAIATSDTLYYRFHGVPHLYNSLYDSRKLEQVVHGIHNLGGREAFAYFNNTAEGHAIANAKQLQDICELVH